MMDLDVLVIGGGVSGTAAALMLQQGGARVGLSTSSAGASWFWSGVASVLGPTAPLPLPRSPHDLRTPQADAPTRRLPAIERWSMLRERAPRHPYFTAGVTAGQVAAAADESARLLGLPLSWHEDGAVVPTDQGTSRHADAQCESVLALEAGRDAVLWAEGLGSEADWIAACYRRSTGSACRVLRDESDVRVAARGGEIVLTASLPAPSFEALGVSRAELAERIGAPVFECAGTVDSVFGERLRRRLAQHHGTLTRVPPITCLPQYTAEWVSGDSCESGSWRARVLLVASGGRVGRGIGAAWLAPWLSDRAPAARSHWMRPDDAGGITHAADLRLMVGGRPLPNAWAVGATLAGHDPATDGTAMGVALWSAAHASRQILATLDAEAAC